MSAECRVTDKVLTERGDPVIAEMSLWKVITKTPVVKQAEWSSAVVPDFDVAEASSLMP